MWIKVAIAIATIVLTLLLSFYLIEAADGHYINGFRLKGIPEYIEVDDKKMYIGDIDASKNTVIIRYGIEEKG